MRIIAPRMRRLTSGIYRIANIVTDEFYIGQSDDIVRRWNGHLCRLGQNRHHNWPLQKSYNEHGLIAFRLDVVEVCHIEKLIERERHWIKELRPQFNNLARKPKPFDPSAVLPDIEPAKPSEPSEPPVSPTSLMCRLPDIKPRQKLILALVMNGVSQVEIAKRLKCSQPSVCTSIRRGRKKIESLWPAHPECSEILSALSR